MARELLDITAPKTPVEIEIRNDGKVIWVHLEGETVLRICQIPNGEVIVNDHRSDSIPVHLPRINRQWNVMRIVDEIWVSDFYDDYDKAVVKCAEMNRKAGKTLYEVAEQ